MNTTATTSSGQRMDNAATLVPEAIKAILAVSKAAKNDTVPETTVELVHLPRQSNQRVQCLCRYALARIEKGRRG